MTADELRAACLALPGAREERPFSRAPEVTTVFKVGGKMFALSRLGGRAAAVSLKCEPELAAALRGDHAAIRPATTSTSATGTPSCSTAAARPDGQDMIEDSYDLVVSALPKARQAEIR